MTRNNLAKLPKKKKRHKTGVSHRDANPRKKLLAATQSMANSHGSPQPKKTRSSGYPPALVVSLIVLPLEALLDRSPCCPSRVQAIQPVLIKNLLVGFCFFSHVFRHMHEAMPCHGKKSTGPPLHHPMQHPPCKPASVLVFSALSPI